MTSHKKKSTARSSILYLSIEGILEPLGFSQVARVLKGLGRQHVITLVSMEKPKNLSDEPRVHAMSAQLALSNIRWVPLLYKQGGPKSALSNLSRLTLSVQRLARTQQPTMLHARGYLPALAALSVKRLQHIPYIFDKRGFWVDEKRDGGSWFTHPLAYKAGKAMESHLFEQAAAVVSLTGLGAEEVLAGTFGPWSSEKPVRVMTTVTDFQDFVIVEREPALSPKLTIGFVGSLNASYHVDESLKLFTFIHELEPRAQLLGLTMQSEELAARAQACGIPSQCVRIESVPHADMPAHMARMDWGLLLLRTTFAKRASMPTKLGEFLACGVRPVHHGCNEEVAQWVRDTGSGISLAALDEGSLRDAAHAIVASWQESLRDPAQSMHALKSARQLASSHFSLEEGVARYGALYQLLGDR